MPFNHQDPISLFLRDWRNFVWCIDMSLPLCRWCRGPLPPRCTAYCSEACQITFQENHFWQQAAWCCRMRYGGACADCGATGSYSRTEFRGVVEDENGQHRLDWEKTSEHNPLEAHHIQPPIVVPRFCSCYNHQSNLILVCARCHRARHKLINPASRALYAENRKFLADLHVFCPREQYPWGSCHPNVKYSLTPK